MLRDDKTIFELAYRILPLQADVSSLPLHIRWQWRNFSISAVFRHFMGQALRNVCCSDVSRRHFLNKIAIVWTFSQTNWFNFIRIVRQTSPFNYTRYDVLTYKMAIALRPQICDVTSRYVFRWRTTLQRDAGFQRSDRRPRRRITSPDAWQCH